MKMKVFGNIIRAARGARNWFGGGVARALVTTAAVLFACTAWAKTYQQSAMTNGRKWWYYLDSSGNAVIEHENSSTTYTAAISITATGDLDIPSSLDGHPVVGIGDKAFYACNKMTSVTIPSGVKDIGFAAFYNCTTLETVNLPNSLEEILNYAFGYCVALESITIPFNVTVIAFRAFTHCSALESVTIPAAVTILGNNAFEDCESLDEVTLPASLVAADVKDRCFSGCSDDLEILSTAVSDGLTWHFKIVNGGAELCWDGENDEPTIPSTTSVAVVIPATLGGLPVVSIGEEAFMDCDKVPSVTIPATVTSIGDWAFSDCSSMTLTVPDTVTDIGEAAFKGCDAMADANGFVIVRGVLHHYTDKDDHVTIPAGVTRIGPSALAECKIDSVEIPSSVKSIGGFAFRECEYLEAVEIPASVTSIGMGAFFGCESLADAEGFVIVRNVLYYYDGDAATVTIPGGVTAVDIYAFQDNDDVKKVTIPASATKIEYCAFAQCDRLTEVTIPKGVTYIGSYAFVDVGDSWKVFLKTVHVETGDTDRVRSLLVKSGHDVAGITFVEDVAESCEVTFNANGGSVSPATRRVTKGAALGILPEPVRDGFIFDGWFTAVEGGAEVSSGSIVTGATTYYAHWTEIVEAVWFTSRADAIAEARKTGKKIFLICGRDTCYNTMTTKNVSCEEPAVKAALTAKCVLWYSNCDTQEDENWYYWPMGVSVTLPLVCIIDPNDPDHYIKRTTGGDHGGPLSGADILAFIADIPAPGTPGTVTPGTVTPGTVTPGSVTPGSVTPGSVTPGPASGCYTFLDAGAITAPYVAGNTLYGALYDGCSVVGIVELKLGKINARKGTSRVSGAVTLLDGKRYTIKGFVAAVRAAEPLTVSLEVKKVGTLSVTIGGEQFAGTLGSWHAQTAIVGGNWTSAPTVSVDASDLSMIPGTVLDALLPNAEKGVSSGTRWTFAKATSVKWAKPKVGETPVVLDAASGKGLLVDTTKDRTNPSGMKLTYTAKKGTFKGSFKVYALEGSGASTKLKKYTLKVGGVVVNGVGYGSATCKRPAITWSVTVE